MELKDEPLWSPWRDAIATCRHGSTEIAGTLHGRPMCKVCASEWQKEYYDGRDEWIKVSLKEIREFPDFVDVKIDRLQGRSRS